jgi:hypothetical protein
MPKFGDVGDPGFLAVSGEIRRWIRDTIGDREQSQQDQQNAKSELDDGFLYESGKHSHCLSLLKASLLVDYLRIQSCKGLRVQ